MQSIWAPVKIVSLKVTSIDPPKLETKLPDPFKEIGKVVRPKPKSTSARKVWLGIIKLPFRSTLATRLLVPASINIVESVSELIVIVSGSCWAR